AADTGACDGGLLSTAHAVPTGAARKGQGQRCNGTQSKQILFFHSSLRVAKQQRRHLTAEFISIRFRRWQSGEQWKQLYRRLPLQARALRGKPGFERSPATRTWPFRNSRYCRPLATNAVEQSPGRTRGANRCRLQQAMD